MPHFLLGSTYGNYRNVMRHYGGCSREHRLRSVGIALFCLLTAPIRTYESLRHRRQIRRVELHPEPIFLIGHWQSGHSPLHMLFSCDQQFAYLDTVQAAFPSSFVCSDWLLRPLLNRLLRGKDRGSDSIRLTTKLPQGSDLPMAALCEYSAYHAYVFPNRAQSVFTRGVMLDGLSERELQHWKDQYVFLMQKLAYFTGKTQVLVRNASDTARIPQLLSLFPKAKFVYIARNPYAMVRATHERWDSMCRLWSLQDGDPAVLHEQTFEFCEQLIRRYLSDRSRIPAGQLTQVRFEDLCDNPVGTMRRIYDDLALAGGEDAAVPWETAAETAMGSLAGQTPYFDDAFRTAVRERLEFVFEEFGYTP